jgi:hypothetical protein
LERISPASIALLDVLVAGVCGFRWSSGSGSLFGNKWQFAALSGGATEERVMPVLFLWAVPAVIFVGGVGYLLVHAH